MTFDICQGGRAIDAAGQVFKPPEYHLNLHDQVLVEYEEDFEEFFLQDFEFKGDVKKSGIHVGFVGLLSDFQMLQKKYLRDKLYLKINNKNQKIIFEYIGGYKSITENNMMGNLWKEDEPLKSVPDQVVFALPMEIDGIRLVQKYKKKADK